MAAQAATKETHGLHLPPHETDLYKETGMSGSVGLEQALALHRENTMLKEDLARAQDALRLHTLLLFDIRAIAKQHEGCECSAGLMILGALDRE